MGCDYEADTLLFYGYLEASVWAENKQLVAAFKVWLVVAQLAKQFAKARYCRLGFYEQPGTNHLLPFPRNLGVPRHATSIGLL